MKNVKIMWTLFVVVLILRVHCSQRPLVNGQNVLFYAPVFCGPALQVIKQPLRRVYFTGKDFFSTKIIMKLCSLITRHVFWLSNNFSINWNIYKVK